MMYMFTLFKDVNMCGSVIPSNVFTTFGLLEKTNLNGLYCRAVEAQMMDTSQPYATRL